MILIDGALAHPNQIPRARWLPAIALALFASALFAPPRALAQGDPPLTLSQAERLALSHEPGQASYLARANALGEEAIAVGQLPDPTLKLGLANYPLQSGGFSTEGMTQAQLGLRQAFPPGKTRQIKTRQFQSMASEMTSNADARARDVTSAVRAAWLETFYWERAQEIVSESRPYFNDLARITRSLYAVGVKDQQDVLRAQLELSRIDDRLIEINKRRLSARAALAQWIGRDAERPLSEALPNWTSPPAIETLRTNLRSHPAVHAAEARVAAKRAGIDLAKERFKPGWAIDFGYGFRDGDLPNGEPRSDFVSVSVSVDLPVFRKQRQNRRLAAALAERRAADESQEALTRRLLSELEAQFAQWQDLSRRLVIYHEQIVPQTRLQSQAALLAYQSDAGDFADVMRGSIDTLNARLDQVRIKVERAQSYVVLANLGGLSR